MPLHSELLFNALCDSGCPDWLDYHFQKKFSYFLSTEHSRELLFCALWANCLDYHFQYPKIRMVGC